MGDGVAGCRLKKRGKAGKYPWIDTRQFTQIILQAEFLFPVNFL